MLYLYIPKQDAYGAGWRQCLEKNGLLNGILIGLCIDLMDENDGYKFGAFIIYVNRYKKKCIWIQQQHLLL